MPVLLVIRALHRPILRANGSDDAEPYDTIALTKLVIVQNINKNYTTQDLKVKSNRSAPIIPTSLVVNEVLPLASNTSEFGDSKVVADDVVIYLSVLRYNNKPIDICPVSRKYGEEWDFDNIQHYFNKSTISAEEALELVADYGWKIENSRLSKSFSYERYTKSKFPKYLTRTIEAMRLQ